MEVGSETGMMASREPFTQSQPSMQSMRLAFTPDGTAIYKHVSPPPSFPAELQPVASRGLNAGNVTTGEAVKRKRGRPRKYGPDGALNVGLSPVVAPQVSGGFSSPVGVNSASSPGGADAGGVKKARGRPPGSGKKQQMSGLGSAGTGFVPHVVIVKTGEDISSKIMSFLPNGPRAVCILSANGAVSNVTLRQSTISGGTVTYEGRFEILALSGSFLLSESNGQRSRTGGLSVSLAGSDGRVLGGGVAGLLTAASPVQVVVGSFLADGRKESNAPTPLETVFGANLSSAGAMGGAGSPTSRGTMSESSGGPGSPLNQNKGSCSNGNQQGIPNMPWKLS